MSKLSFRARALDATKPMPVYKTEEIPDLPDFAAINRAVPQMPTGMEKEEETEHHLQRALSAQQVYGTAEALVIPIPEIDDISATYKRLYEAEGGYKPPRQYIHVQPFAMDQEIPDYDMDSEDESWLGKQSRKLEVTPFKFETMMDRLEKGSGQTVMTLHEAKALLKEDDDLIIAVYDYWLNKRLKLQHALIPTVRTEKRDGSTSNNPYVAFRRRTEKMQTRKNRKNDEVSYEKMLKLRRDLNKALTVLELMKRREKSKKELLKLTIEIVEKRYQMQDYDGQVYNEANAKRHTLPSTFIQSFNEYINARKWQDRVHRQEEQTYAKKTKRKYNKRKDRERIPSSHQVPISTPAVPAVQLPQYTEVEVLHEPYSSEEEMSPHLSASEPEVDSSENDPDGAYAFKRKPGCQYHAPIDAGCGNWPWHGREEGGVGDTKYRYSLTSLSRPTARCVGYARRRIGRGGRMMVDRMSTEWDDALDGMDLSGSPDDDDISALYAQQIKHDKIRHFRPKSGAEEEQVSSALLDITSPTSSLEFNLDSFDNHRQQLLQMTRQQQHEHLVPQDGAHFTDLTASDAHLAHSFSSQPNSKFTLDSPSAVTSLLTLDSQSAQFAASAVQCLTSSHSVTSSSAVTPVATSQSAVSAHSDVLSVALSELSGLVVQSGRSSSVASPLVCHNAPIDVKPSVFSTSPAANVLQLNYPINHATSIATTPSNASHSLATNSSHSSRSLITHPSSQTSHHSNVTTLSYIVSTPSNVALDHGGMARSVNSTPTLLNSSLFPVSIATKCVSPATPALLKIASTAQIKADSISKDTLEGASILKDKSVPMEVT